MNDVFGAFYKAIHGSVDLDDLIPLSRLKVMDGREVIRHFGESVLVSLNQVEAVADYLECSLDDLYYLEGHFHPFCYYKDYLFIDFINLDLPTMEFLRLKESIKFRRAKIEEFLRQKDYRSLYMTAVDKKVAFSLFKRDYENLPDEDKYPIFLDLYVRSEYGFPLLGLSLYEDLKSRRSPEYMQDVQRRLLPHATDGKLVIYRGEGTGSTPYTEALSWTLSILTANFFATRYGVGKIYRTEVAVEDVMDFIEDRDESEILILPRDLGVVEEVPIP